MSVDLFYERGRAAPGDEALAVEMEAAALFAVGRRAERAGGVRAGRIGHLRRRAARGSGSTTTRCSRPPSAMGAAAIAALSR